MQQYLVGIDVGSSMAKASIFDTEGGALGIATHDSHPRQPRPGVAEYDGPELLAAVLAAVRDLLERTRIPPRDVAALALDGMISGTMAIDAAGDALTPYTTTLDQRFAPQLNYVLDHFHDPIRRLTGAGQPTFAPKMLWVRQEFPGIYARTAKFVTITGYIASKMAGLSAGDAFIDTTYLWATGLSDTARYTWSADLCRAMDLSEEKLPRIVAPSAIVGHISREIAAVTGLQAGTPVVAGCGDQSAGFLAAGITRPGRLGDAAGTYPILSFCTDEFRPDLAGRQTEILASAVPGLWNPISLIIGGGLTHHWFRETFGCADEQEASRRGGGVTAYNVLDETAGRVAPGSDKLFFIPHLGGRACPTCTDFRGLWIGFTWTHKRAHFYRAVLEAIAYDQHLALQSLEAAYPESPVAETRVYSGGARSALWNQIKADVMGLPYVSLEREDLVALGVAILAGHAVGLYDDMVATAERFVQGTGRFEPQPEVHAFYEGCSAYYARLLDHAAPAYADLAALPEWPVPP